VFREFSDGITSSELLEYNLDGTKNFDNWLTGSIEFDHGFLGRITSDRFKGEKGFDASITFFTITTTWFQRFFGNFHLANFSVTILCTTSCHVEPSRNVLIINQPIVSDDTSATGVTVEEDFWESPNFNKSYSKVTVISGRAICHSVGSTGSRSPAPKEPSPSLSSNCQQSCTLKFRMRFVPFLFSKLKLTVVL
jgi:hypothetical protein